VNGMPWWANLIVQAGAVGVLLLVLYAIWQVVIWAKVNVAEPVVKKHLELIETLTTHFPKQTEAVEKQTEMLGEVKSEVEGQTASIDQSNKLLEGRTQLFEKIIEKLDAK